MGTTVTRGATTADSWKAALYSTAGSLGAGTTAYSATNEASGTNYTAGGVAFTWTAPSSSGTTAFTTPSAAFAWTNVSIGPIDAVLLYNTTQSNKAMGVYTFGAQTITAADFSLTMPTNDATNGLFRIA